MSLNHLELRRSFLSSLGVDHARVFFLRQIHSKKVINPERDPEPFKEIWKGSWPEGDGLITGDRETVLCVSVADCLPVFLHDTHTGAFGLLHSGWKGTGIVEAAVEKMRRDLGSLPSNLRVILGPCIGPCCYNVDLQRYDLFFRRFGEKSVKKRGSEYYLDLKAANVSLLEREGVQDITIVDDCTSCNTDLGSFRRDGDGFTHMLAVVGYF
jgi:YfiH family protein